AFPKKQPVCEVEVHVFEKEGMVHFEVKDNGQGIEEERLEQLGKMVVLSKKGTGTALYNINERLIGLFGKETMHFHFAYWLLLRESVSQRIFNQ
ncbi:ATP-binding protein, partial [Bacillus sp. D-CC]